MSIWSVIKVNPPGNAELKKTIINSTFQKSSNFRENKSPVTVSSIFKPHYCSNTCACLKQVGRFGFKCVNRSALGWYSRCKPFTTQKNRSVILVLAVMFDNLSQTYLLTVKGQLAEFHLNHWDLPASFQ